MLCTRPLFFTSSFSSHAVHATLLWAVAWGMYCVFSPGHTEEMPSCIVRFWVDLEHAVVTGGIRAFSQALEVFTLVHLIVDSHAILEIDNAKIQVARAGRRIAKISAAGVGLRIGRCTGLACGNDPQCRLVD